MMEYTENDLLEISEGRRRVGYATYAFIEKIRDKDFLIGLYDNAFNLIFNHNLKLTDGTVKLYFNKKANKETKKEFLKKKTAEAL